MSRAPDDEEPKSEQSPSEDDRIPIHRLPDDDCLNVLKIKPLIALDESCSIIAKKQMIVR